MLIESVIIISISNHIVDINYLATVGLTMAIVRGFANMDTLKRSWEVEKVNELDFPRV